MRSQIIHLTLRQEGSTERRRAKLKESEGEKRECERDTKGRKTNKRMNGVNCKGAGGSRMDRGENGDEKMCACVCVRERTGLMERNRK